VTLGHALLQPNATLSYNGASPEASAGFLSARRLHVFTARGLRPAVAFRFPSGEKARVEKAVGMARKSGQYG
jgi:hypothetical protein